MSARRDAEGVHEDAGRLAELGVLSSVLLHELRQPLFALQATAEVALAAAPDDARWRAALDRVRHLERLVDGFGELAQRPDPRDVRCDAQGAVRWAVRLLDARARQARADLELPDGGPAWVGVGSTAVRQMAVNLLHNALDAVDGRPERRVAVRLVGGPDALVVEVRDSGPGIDPAVADDLFEPFVTTKGTDRGTGLGLYVTRLLARRAGGDVEVRDSGGAGTTMALRLPRAGG